MAIGIFVSLEQLVYLLQVQQGTTGLVCGRTPSGDPESIFVVDIYFEAMFVQQGEFIEIDRKTRGIIIRLVIEDGVFVHDRVLSDVGPALDGKVADVGGQGEGDAADVGIVSVMVPVHTLEIDGLGHHEGLVLSITKGDGDGGIGSEKAVLLPRSRGSGDPGMPEVDETLMKADEVRQAEVDHAIGLTEMTHDFCGILHCIPGKWFWVWVQAVNVLVAHLREDVGDEHDDHACMVRGNDRVPVIQRWELVGRVIWITNVKEDMRDDRKPELVVESSADIHHPALGIEWESVGSIVRPETEGHGQLEFGSPVMIGSDVGKYSIEATTGADIQSIVEVVRAEARDKVRAIGVDTIVVIDVNAMTIGQQRDRWYGSSVFMEVRQGPEGDVLEAMGIEEAEMVRVSWRMVRVKCEVDIDLCMRVTSCKLLRDLSDVERGIVLAFIDDGILVRGRGIAEARGYR